MVMCCLCVCVWILILSQNRIIVYGVEESEMQGCMYVIINGMQLVL